LSICAHAAPNETSSLKAWRAKLEEPPASGKRTVPSVYVSEVATKITPAITKTSGVSPSANAAVTPSA
jgi:hypothetical protein